MDEVNITLCNETNENGRFTVKASIIDGCLKISGQDLGKAVEGSFGENEYEYYYDFDRVNTERLFSLLKDGETSAENILAARFGGIEGCKALRKFCDGNKIKYSFFSYF